MAANSAFSSRVALWLRGQFSFAMTALIYNVPEIIILPTYGVLLFRFSQSTVAWAVFITVATLVPAPTNYVLLTPLTLAFATHVLGFYWSLSQKWIQGDSLVAVFPWSTCVFEVAVAVFWALYIPTYYYYPEEYGYRRSPRILRFLRRCFYDEAVRYFSMKVLCSDEMKGVLKLPGKQFVFGYHPHGVYPGTAMYASGTQPWIEALGENPKNLVTCHVASIVFNGPILRDFVMANGCRAVTRTAIERNLKEGNSSLIVVGGQSDLLLTHQRDTEQHYVVHHLGFIRIALQQGVPLVPVINFAEHNVMDTVHWYSFQRLMLRILRFPLLVIPVGRFCLPVPNQVPVVLAVGRPIEVPKDVPADPDEFEEVVLQVAERYYEEVIRTFYFFRSQTTYPHMELFLHCGIPEFDPTIKGTPEYEAARTHPDRPFRFPRKHAPKGVAK